MLGNVTLRTQVNGGQWSIVKQVAYDYYDGTSQKPYGNLGDLRTATTMDGNNNIIDTMYYRYYTSADAGTTGYVHGLKYSFSVSRRPKPATHEHLKTSHCEETRIGRVGSSAVSAEGDPTWRINSRWHSSRPFSPCIGGVGRSGALPGN
jgi:hypothetical protein